MSVHVTSRVWKHKRVRGSDLVVLLRLADDADETGLCWPAAQTLAEDCGLEERQIRRSLRTLEDAGEIAVITGQGRGYVSVYIVLTGLDVRERAERIAGLEQRAADLNAMLKARRERGHKSPLSGKEKGVIKAPFLQKKGDIRDQEKGTSKAIKGDMSIGDFGSTKPDRVLTHHDPSCDPPPPPCVASVERPVPDAANAAGGGGGRAAQTEPTEQRATALTGRPDTPPPGSVPPPPPPSNPETRQLLRDAGVKAPAALRRLSGLDPAIVRQVLAGLRGESGLKSTAAVLVAALDACLGDPALLPAVAPASTNGRPPPSDTEILRSPHLDAQQRALWLARYRAAAPTPEARWAVLERLRAEVAAPT